MNSEKPAVSADEEPAELPERQEEKGNEPAPRPEFSRRRWVLYLLVFVSVSMQFARICQVRSKTGEVPFHSANDRSRWCTIAVLAVSGKYEIDDLLFQDGDKKAKKTPWYSIDLVRHRGSDGKLHYYSSKPPLLPTLYAGAYWIVMNTSGMTLSEDTFVVARILLLLVNLLPLAAFWVFWVRAFCKSENEDDWNAIVLTSFLVFGTFLTTFANTLNNHLPAAIAVGVSVWCLHQVLVVKDTRLRWFVLAGVCTSFGAANELPALGWVAAVGAMLLVANPLKACVGYVPALLPVALAFFGFNYQAHGEFSPAYAHRDVGRLLFTFDISAETNELSLAKIVQALESEGIQCSRNCLVRPARRERTFEFLDTEKQQQYALRLAEDEKSVAVHDWGDWYDYPGSYWAGRKQGVTKGNQAAQNISSTVLSGITESFH